MGLDATRGWIKGSIVAEKAEAAGGLNPECLLVAASDVIHWHRV